MRIAFPTPPRPIKATGIGRVVGIFGGICSEVGICVECMEGVEFWIFRMRKIRLRHLNLYHESTENVDDSPILYLPQCTDDITPYYRPLYQPDTKMAALSKSHPVS